MTYYSQVGEVKVHNPYLLLYEKCEKYQFKYKNGGDHNRYQYRDRYQVGNFYIHVRVV